MSNLAQVRKAATLLTQRGHGISTPRSVSDYPRLRADILNARGFSPREVHLASAIMRKTYGKDNVRTASMDDLKASVGTAVVQTQLDKLPSISTTAQKGFDFLYTSVGATSPQKYLQLIQKASKEPASDEPYVKLLGRVNKGGISSSLELCGAFTAAMKSKDNSKVASVLGVDEKVILMINSIYASKTKTAARKIAVAESWWATPILNGVGWVWENIIEWLGKSAWATLQWVFGTSAMKYVGSALVWLIKLLIPDSVEEAMGKVNSALSGEYLNTESWSGKAMAFVLEKLGIATTSFGHALWSIITAIPGVIYSVFKKVAHLIYEYVPHDALLIGLGAALLIWYLVTYFMSLGAKIAQVPPKVFLMLPFKGVWWVVTQVFKGAIKLTSNGLDALLKKLGIRKTEKDKIDELVEFSNVNSQYTSESQQLLDSILQEG